MVFLGIKGGYVGYADFDAGSWILRHVLKKQSKSHYESGLLTLKRIH